MMNEAEHYRAVANGRRNKVAGEHWERMIEATCEYYSQQGVAEIAKTPEPMKPIQSLGKGKFVAVFEKKAQPDYKGTMKGGGAIVFEAKHTDTGRLQQSAVTEEQAAQLDKHAALGAECYIIVSFGFERYFKVPWATFRDMKRIYGRRYITPEDVRKHEFRYTGGVLHFL